MTAAAAPLAGLVFAVDDTIEVGAPALRRLLDAGALFLGERELAGPGSAVAVASGIADFAVATGATVPTGLRGIVGLKPTPGLVPVTGIVPPTRPYDRMTVFAPTLELGQRALAVMTGPDPRDPRSRPWPPSVRLAAPDRPKIAIPDDSELAPLATEAKYAFHAAVGRLRGFDATVECVEVTPFLETARLFADAPAAGEVSAHRFVAELERLDRARMSFAASLKRFDALLLPTSDTGFVNLFDLAAVGVPAGRKDENPLTVSIVTRGFEDQVAIDIAARLTGEQAATPYPTGIDLVADPGLRAELTHLGARSAGLCEGSTPLRASPPPPSSESRAGERWTISAAGLGQLAATRPGRGWRLYS
ncbi:MAG TPA: amidase family protein [Amycolatopsis sp.]|uniref:amidase family protein n=1 Tax=Amycolatopsis sp. TaxID=37632 RepID=UPI002B45C54D|nr:amidase family protein [Amycolatopsis sp.]HKS47614.1 amidase family protein [Amycolatopsis sp.]